jgi:RND family efflux transporter MFP subunit
MSHRSPTAVRWLSIGLLSCAGLTGCGGAAGQSGPPKPPPPEVKVSQPVSETVTDYEDFPGRLVAKKAVEIRARVTGYLLDEVIYVEGTDVEKGEVLFVIDPRPYQAELERAQGNVMQSKGRLKRMDEDYERAKGLEAKGNLSKEELARVTGDRTEAQGALKVNEAALKLAELDVEFTKVKAPISGRVSSRSIDPGNLVKADDTSLTSIVSLDPIYATFDLDERSLLRLQRLIRDKTIPWSLDRAIPVNLGLSDEKGFPHQGAINFADNRVDADTGTWRLRGEFANKDHALTPGLFVRIRLPMGAPYRALLVAEEALGTNQGQKYVFVVDDKGHVTQRDVTVGRLQNGLRVIVKGLSADEKIVVDGLQRVREGIEVKAEDVPMPRPEEHPDDEQPGT